MVFYGPLSSYAEDFYLYESAPDLDALTEQLRSVSACSVRKKLKIEPSKSHMTLFTPWTKEINKHPAVFIDGTLIALNKTP
jgi:hypothetical protein